MDATFHALGRILLNAVPTFLLLLFLIAYLRGMFFGPLGSILAKRHQETEGARQAAAESLRHAEQRVAEYEARLRQARGDIYAEQDLALKKAGAEVAAQIETARREAGARVAKSSAELHAQAEESKASLESRSAELADLIVSRVLEGRAA